MSSKSPTARRRTISDPLSAALLPPPNETPADRERRLYEEYEAKKVSDNIDEQLKQERAALRRKKAEVKVLLLGQSESGKSTTLKQFQLLHTPAAFHAERIAWRSVIYLNLVRSVRRILEALIPPPPDSIAATVADYPRNGYPIPFDESASVDFDRPSFEYGRPPSVLSDHAVRRLEKYAKRLAPLAGLEERLIRQLSCPDEDEATHLETPMTTYHVQPVQSPGMRPKLSLVPVNRSASQPSSSPVSPITSPGSKELALSTSSNWKKSFSLGGKITVRSPKSAHTGEVQGWWEDPDDPVHVLNACAGGEYGMVALWKDEEVRETLRKRRVRMEESSGFYLDEIERITAKKYIPTNNDVLKARLKTLGVVEHTFTLKGSDKGAEWKIYDVGGARNQRQAWAPYFDDVNAIIFLAPISAFDQVLAEDPRVNRLEDSLLLWRSLVSNKLLSEVNIILFLNKCDLLRSKLDAGVQLNHHMLSYGDRPNDYDSVSNYFRNKFGALHQAFTPNKDRELYIHMTSVTDTRKTSTIISNVRDMILRGNLKGSRLI